MKLAVVFLTLTILTKQCVSLAIGSDFLNGFETGIVSRNNDEMFAEHDCEAVANDNTHSQSMRKIFDSIKSFGSVKGSNMMDGFFEAVDIFLENFGTLETIMFRYDGSDYCTGLNFGYNGANLLTSIA